MVLSLSVPSFSRSTTTTPPLRSRHGSYSATLSEALRSNPFGLTSQSRSRSSLASSQVDEQRREQEELNNALETLVQIFPDVKIEVFRELLVRFDGNSRLHVCVEQLMRHKEKWVAGRWNVPSGPAGNEGGGDAVVVAASDDNDNNGSAAGEPLLLVPRDERFRTDEYKSAVRGVLMKEFNGLSRSAVDAVLAEVNFCYTRARPVLQDLSRKTWRATFNSLLPSFKRKKDRDDHPMMLWQRHADGEVIPRLRETGCEELDRELHEALLAPLLRMRLEEREQADLRLAEELNEKEAEAAGALYECECCFTDVTFEQISTCSDTMHVICFSCIRHTVHQALFGQGWGTSIDIERSTLRCLAPSTHERCKGILSAAIVKRAILLDKAGLETYSKFEAKLASDALLQSRFKLIRCPFCSYAEVDPVYHPSEKGVTWRFRFNGLIPTIITTLIILDAIPFLLILMAILYFFEPSALPTIFNNAVRNLCLKIRMKRFTCANPSCRRVSCITCQKPWRDPHICHEPLLLDLRATVEAARTAAVKRTCPRCGLSFVKSSGCNKLTCTCGYSMCYLCRKALGPPLKPANERNRARNNRRRRRRPRRQGQENVNPIDPINQDQDENPNQPEEEYIDYSEEDTEDVEDEEEQEQEEETNEGYRHFCEHFRINPGARCTACNKCELYQDEDEEAVARRAGEKAEYEWRLRHQMAATGAGIGSVSVNHDLSVTTRAGGAGGGNKRRSGLFPFSNRRGASSSGFQGSGSGKGWMYWLDGMWQSGQWRVEGQAFVDWIVEQVIVIQEI